MKTQPILSLPIVLLSFRAFGKSPALLLLELLQTNTLPYLQLSTVLPFKSFAFRRVARQSLLFRTQGRRGCGFNLEPML